jgi:Right handed beta helix region
MKKFSVAFFIVFGLFLFQFSEIGQTAPITQFYVSPSDLTLDNVRNSIRELKKAGKLPKQGAIVWLKGGTYLLDKTFELTAEDSGTKDAPITYRAVTGENVRIVNGKRFALSNFEKVKDKTTLARIPEKLRGKILELDLKKYNIYHRKLYKDVFSDNGGIINLYFDDKRMPLSRFPNEGYMTMKKVLDTAGGVQDKNWSAPVDSGIKPDPNKGGTFEYREEFYDNHAKWKNILDRGVWMKGFWRVMWQNEAVRVKDIDTENKTVTLSKPLAGGIGNKYTRPFGNGREMYWLMNLLEEIDSPGEWSVDFKDEKLYFYPPNDNKNAEIFIADADAPVISMKDASHIVLRDIEISGSLSHGILIQGGEENLIAGCKIHNVTKYAIKIDGGFRHSVQGCDLYDLGAGGVWLGGGDEKSEPRIPAGHRVVNNHIYNFSQIEQIYAPAVNSGFTGGGGGGHHTAVGMYVANNLIHDTPHAGVLFASWDSVFEYNEVFRYCLVSNDVGAFYSYDQYERMGNITFRYNFFHSSDDGDGIYFDHDHRDMKVYGNIAFLNSKGKRGTAYLYKIGSQAKNPYTTDVQNNIAIGSNIGFLFDTSGRDTNQNNVAIMTKKPFIYKLVKDGKETKSTTEELASGKNMAYTDNPGFVNMQKFDFRLKPDAQIFKDLPNFKPIPVEKIGLYIDEYRKKLPTDEEIDRFDLKPRKKLAGYDILDRGN